jgi:hypothetical protein
MDDLIEAADLLDADLVWDGDLDAIRYHLAGILRAISENRDPIKYAEDLAETLLDEHHNDLRIN